MYKTLVAGTIAISLTCVIGFSQFPAEAQTQQPRISVVNLAVQPGSNGQQLVITPRGKLVPLPGAGVNSDSVELYMGSTGGYWYVDRNGQTVDLTGYVQQIRAQSEQAPQAPPPQYAPYAAYPTTAAPAQSTNNSMGTAMAAGMGAMAGSAMSGRYYNNVPYGTPMYYGNGAHPCYHNEHGQEIFVEDGEVHWDNVNAAKQQQQANQQAKYNQASTARDQNQAENQQQREQAQASRQGQQDQRYQQRQTQQDERTAQRQPQNPQSQRYQQQQQWYGEQTRNPERAQAWQQQSSGENPFVRSEQQNWSAMAGKTSASADGRLTGQRERDSDGERSREGRNRDGDGERQHEGRSRDRDRESSGGGFSERRGERSGGRSGGERRGGGGGRRGR